MAAPKFETDGYAVTAPLFDDSECRTLDAHLPAIAPSMAGSRFLLDAGWCQTLARSLRNHPSLASLLPRGFVAVQCTLFEKSLDRNWLVPLHQDLSIPVLARSDHPALTGWSEKEGNIFVQAPVDVLESLVAVRLHIDACALEDGPLKVVPGSHRYGRIHQAGIAALRAAHGEAACPAARGAALVMRPLLLHASSKATGHSRRRVLHFLFAPPLLPFGLQWRHAV